MSQGSFTFGLMARKRSTGTGTDNGTGPKPNANARATAPARAGDAAPIAPRRSPIPNRLTLGIDEAGRGPSIGPMVMAAVALDSRTAAVLTRAGLCDSKSYGAGEDAHAIRCELDKVIRERAKFVVTIEVEHTEIDERVTRGELNMLERELATRMIEQAHSTLEAVALRVDKIIADGKRMFFALGQRFERFESHDRAEEKHAAVAAASVVAKVIRDERFAKIRRRYEDELGPIAGGGYANAATRKWLRAYVERYGRLPEEARLSWPHPYVIDLIGDVQLKGPQAELFG
jgi:ribonuclease HII